jgi:type IV pilus assembly protein PilC
MLAVLEPTLVILLSLVVGVILLSVMLPLMGILSSI